MFKELLTGKIDTRKNDFALSNNIDNIPLNN